MRLIDAAELLRRYDEEHEGEPGRARKLIEDAPTVNAWISVKDRLPKEQERCLVYIPPFSDWDEEFLGRIDMLVYVPKENGGYWFGADRRGYSEPTHWMPLPEPPKEV